MNNCDGLLFLAGQVDGVALGHNRVVQLPAKSWTLTQIWDATKVLFLSRVDDLCLQYHALVVHVVYHMYLFVSPHLFAERTQSMLE